MPLVSGAEVVLAAAKAGRGVGAFNVIQLEHATALIAGAEQAGAPVILQISPGAIVYAGYETIRRSVTFWEGARIAAVACARSRAAASSEDTASVSDGGGLKILVSLGAAWGCTSGGTSWAARPRCGCTMRVAIPNSPTLKSSSSSMRTTGVVSSA